MYHNYTMKLSSWPVKKCTSVSINLIPKLKFIHLLEGCYDLQDLPIIIYMDGCVSTKQKRRSNKINLL